MTTNGPPRIDLTDAQRAAVAALSHDDGVIPMPLWLARQATIPNDALERLAALRDPEAFWRERGALVEWMKPFEEVLRFDPPRHEWFVGGKLNVTSSCIDRHVHGDLRNKAAILWVGEDGEEQEDPGDSSTLAD